MKWYEYKIKTTVEAEDIMSFVLSNNEIFNIEIEDNVPEDDLSQGKVYKELLPDNPLKDDGKSTIKFYLSSDMKKEERNKIVKDVYDEAMSYDEIKSGDFKIEETFTNEEDWINKWKEFFHKFTIGSFLIKPSWEKDEPIYNDKSIERIYNDNSIERIYDDKSIEPKEKILYIDPGTAFGTGKHESTALSILLLEKYLKEENNVFDMGFGSGILSMVSYKLGAKKVCGTDIAKDALLSLKHNFKDNGIEFIEDDFKIGNIIADQDLFLWFKYKKSDIICANLLADIIEPMRDFLYEGLKEGGVLIVSGIINFRADGLLKSMERTGFIMLERKDMGEWVSFAFKK